MECPKSVQVVEEGVAEKDCGAVEIGRIWNICCVGCRPVSVSNKFQALGEKDEQDEEEEVEKIPDFLSLRVVDPKVPKGRKGFKQVTKKKRVRFATDQLDGNSAGGFCGFGAPTGEGSFGGFGGQRVRGGKWLGKQGKTEKWSDETDEKEEVNAEEFVDLGDNGFSDVQAVEAERQGKGVQMSLGFQVAEVKKPLVAVKRIVEKGNFGFRSGSDG